MRMLWVPSRWHIFCIFYFVTTGRTLETETDIQETRQKRTDYLFQQLEHYETTIPKLVDHQGNFLSFDTRYSTISKHQRFKRLSGWNEIPRKEEEREVLSNSDIAEYRIFYKFSAFGKEFHFDLKLNTRLLSRNFVVEYRSGNEVTKRFRDISKCHYIGYSNEPYVSTAAISNCFGLLGVFSTSDEDYFVEPLWNHTNDVNQGGHPHIVYKRSSLKLPKGLSQCGVLDMHNDVDNPWFLPTSPWFNRYNSKLDATDAKRGNPDIIFKLKPLKTFDKPNESELFQRYEGRRRREVMVELAERNVETMVVVDQKMVEFHKSHELLKPYILTIMNIVAKLYRDPSIGNPINIVVSKLVILTGEQTNLTISHHADRSLDSFCKWQNRLNKSGDPTHDNAVLITRYDICTYKNTPCGTLGLAPVAGMCEEDRSCSINEDIGLASAFTIAHEIGHNFGMQHDGAGNLCGTPGYEPARIMAARLTKDSDPFLWSNCSRQYITDFLESGKGGCLDNRPLYQEESPEAKEDMPGTDSSVEEQCQLQFKNTSYPCRAEEACSELWCTNSDGQCVTNSIPVAEGTTCKNGSLIGKCYRRLCVPFNFHALIVHGEWGVWSSWSECTRTCGGGVEFQERICDSPQPFNGGRYCAGDRKRFRSCNMEPCPKGSLDFRALQCERFNDVPFRGRYFEWVPYNGVQEKPCALNCMAKGYNFYTERASKVIDGTSCYSDNRDMCINGECHDVGCDNVLGSAAVEDKCRVCNGNSTACHKIAGLIEKSLSKGAYQEVLKIPKGAMHIQVKEAYKSTNYLALKSINGPYYINGDWTIDWPRKFPVAGTVFHYQRIQDEPEIIKAIGPTDEDLVVMLLLQEDRTGIEYEYNVPHNSSSSLHDVSQYIWTHSAWAECSRSCGKGMSTSTAVCMNKVTKTVADDGYCFPQPKPSHHFRHCNEQPCPPRWETGEWTECSQTCGGGTKLRIVVCKQLINEDEEVILNESECTESRPSSERTCRKANCPPVWMAEDWSECSKKCGRGEMVRHVYCTTSDKQMYFDESQCDISKKPETIATCVKQSCPPPTWVIGEWSECSVDCGQGWRERSVECMTFDGKSSDLCPKRDKPAVSQRCDVPCDQESGDDECADKYQVAYCPLVLKFRFCDREYFQRMCCKTCHGGRLH